ncbi:hypothetical protein FBUS_03635 [Fasciolopsis buskii]|uniref:Uncharacterized protein n=1 Tax=Fasciolopsis buskii TaxID=27845 RepID=A0A8E0S847_9TREM|nr:hypothetical protein FBUS_03635 [Fasciolopsis buski]
MIVEQLRGRSIETLSRRVNKTSQGQHGSETNEPQHLDVGFRVESNCAKPNLYLEYTCVHAALLHPALRTSSAQEKRLNKSLQFMRRQQTESPGIEQLKEFTLDSFAPSEQENNQGSDGSMPVNSVVTSSSEALHGGPRALLIALLPSVICLLLVSILVAYIFYTKRRSKQNRWCQKQQYHTDQSCSNTLNCPDELMTMASTSASAPTPSNRTLPTFVERGRFLLNLKDRVPWSPNEIRRVSNSLNDPVCCECSEIDGEPVCSTADDVRLTFDSAVTRSINDSQRQNSIQAVHPAKTASHSLSNTVYEGHWGSNINQTCQICSMKSSTIEANSTTLCNQGGKNELNVEKAYGASKQTELYTPFPANYFPITEQNTIGPLFDSTQNWRQYGYAKSKQEPEHKSTTMTIAQPSPRTHSSRLGVVGGHELHQSITRSNSENQAQNPLKLTGQRPAKVAPPLFNSADNFIRNIAEPYQSAHAFKLRFTKIPVVRYPYEVEDDSDEHSQSTNHDHQDGLIPDAGSLLRQNRPDLCPPIKAGDKLSTSSPEDNSRASKKITLLSSYDHMEYNDSNSISIASTVQPNSSPSVIDSCTSPDYTVVDEYKSRVNMSPRPYPRLLSSVSTLSKTVDVHPSPKLSKQLRFQTPVLELPHTVYDQNNVLSTCDMSTSMCRRSNRQP